MTTLMQDIRYALRQLRRSPGFAITAILTIALGIGANTAIFTLANQVLLRHLPVKDADRLYRIGDANDSGIEVGAPPDQRFSGFSTAAYDQLRTMHEFVQLAAMQEESPSPSLVRRANTQDETKAQHTIYVSGNFFNLFQLAPEQGRLLQLADDRPGAPGVAVISYAAWAQRYHSDPAVVGSTFLIDTTPVTVVGIAPRGFYGDRVREDPPVLYLPIAAERLINPHPFSTSPDVRWLYLIGSIRPGTHLPVLQQKVDYVLREFLATLPEYKSADGAKDLARVHAQIIPAAGGVQQLQDQVRTGIYVLAIVSALVLLITCANVANLLLARGASRRAEFALRTAIGASRGRVIRQAITESLLLAVLGGVCGIAIAYAGTRAMLALEFPGATALPISASPSPAVLTFTLTLSLLTGITFGLIPALTATRTQPADALRGQSRSVTNRASIYGKGLVILQAMLSVVLVTTAALLLRSTVNLQTQNFGLETDNLVAAHIDPLRNGYTPARLPAMMAQLHDRLSALPGVQQVAFAMSSPLEGGALTSGVFVEGVDPSSLADNQSSADRVSPGFFATVGQPLLRGRDFSVSDGVNTPLVAVINQSFARKFFRDPDPIGKRFAMYPNQPGFTVIGVVADAKYDGRDLSAAPVPMFFRSLLQPNPNAGSNDLFEDLSAAPGAVLLRTAGAPGAFKQAVRNAMREVDPNLAVVDVRTIRAQIATQLNVQRTVARLTATFGLLALLLASVGLYGVTSYSVAQRVPEIGLRMALGADRRGVLTLVLKQAMTQALIGLALGVPAALLAGHALQSQLFGIKGHDAFTLLGACFVLGLAALIASAVPAHRASTIEPMQALRAE